MKAARLNSIRSTLFVGADGPWISRSSPLCQRRGVAPESFSWVIPTPLGIYLRLFSPPSHLVSEGCTPNKESKDDGEIQKHTAAWPCCTSSTTRPHPEATR